MLMAFVQGQARRAVAFSFIVLLAIAGPVEGRALQGGPALWKVDGARGDIYFFGSIHILPPDLAWRTDELDAALRRAQTIHFEIDIDEAKDPGSMGPLVRRFGFLPAGTTLRSLLAPEYRSQLEIAARKVGLGVDAVDRMRPWLAAITLTALQATQQMSGTSAPPSAADTGGVDARLWAWAKENDKPRGTLESAESQIRLFADLSREQEVQFLVVTLQQSASAGRIIAQLLDAWKTGKAGQLDRLLNSDLDRFPVLRKALFDDRHVRWMPQIEAMMELGGDHVVIVGAAHLVGRGSIIEMLRARGVEVDGP
jgi:uncharacterized protein YbaP (TraB family)